MAVVVRPTCRIGPACLRTIGANASRGLTFRRVDFMCGAATSIRHRDQTLAPW